MTKKARLVKACPCCGSKNIRMDDPKWLEENDLKVVTISCEDCKLSINGYSGFRSVEGKEYTLAQAYQSALKRWNRRAA